MKRLVGTTVSNTEKHRVVWLDSNRIADAANGLSCSAIFRTFTDCLEKRFSPELLEFGLFEFVIKGVNKRRKICHIILARCAWQHREHYAGHFTGLGVGHNDHFRMLAIYKDTHIYAFACRLFAFFLSKLSFDLERFGEIQEVIDKILFCEVGTNSAAKGWHDTNECEHSYSGGSGFQRKHKKSLKVFDQHFAKISNFVNSQSNRRVGA